jgi:hypothetical protein
MSEALQHFRSIAAAICSDSDVLEEDITFGEVRELLAELDGTRRLLRAASRELGHQGFRLDEAHARLRRGMSQIEESWAELRTQKL